MKVLFVGGGTLGHIYPSFPVIQKLVENKHIVYFIGGAKENEKEVLIKNSNIHKVFFLNVEGLKRKVTFKNIITLIKFLKAKKESRKILKEIHPDIVIGMGGYVSGPVLLEAKRLKIKTLIHEQNSVYGLVNKVLKKKVDAVLLTYDIEKGEKYKLVGNPRTNEIAEKYGSKVNLLCSQRKIMVVGGSLGAKKINDYFINNKELFSKNNIEIILITGKKYYEENRDLIGKSHNSFLKIVPFLNDLPQEMLNNRLIISRSGATTMAEIMGLKKMAIFIPSPNVTNNHQYKNAKYFEDKKCCFMVEEKDIDDKLFPLIERILNDNNIEKEIKNNIDKAVIFSSTDKFYQEIMRVVNGRSN